MCTQVCGMYACVFTCADVMHMCTHACGSFEVDQVCSLTECSAYIEAELSLNLELTILSCLAS